MFRFVTGQREKKERIRKMLGRVQYGDLIESDKGFFNEMRSLLFAEQWVPSKEQLERLERMTK